MTTILATLALLPPWFKGAAVLALFSAGLSAATNVLRWADRGEWR